MKRLLTAALVVVCAAIVPLVVLPARSAQAAGVDLLCTGSADLDFFPGLTNSPQTVFVSYTSTLSCPIAPVRISGGSGFGSFTMSGATCTDLTTAAHTATYNWRPRAVSSTIDYSAISANLQVVSQLVQTGSVSAGMSAGDQAVSTITFLNLDLAACFTPTGLTSISGLEQLTLVSL